jgi:hypothetical protein
MKGIHVHRHKKTPKNKTNFTHVYNPLNETHNTHSKQTNTNAHTKTHTTGLQQIKSA